jgi:hypothetical protein
MAFEVWRLMLCFDEAEQQWHSMQDPWQQCISLLHIPLQYLASTMIEGEGCSNERQQQHVACSARSARLSQPAPTFYSCESIVKVATYRQKKERIHIAQIMEHHSLLHLLC